jgi:hypothetical protein
MAAKHDTLTVTSSEIKGYTDDLKTFSLKPEGLIGGNEPVYRGVTEISGLLATPTAVGFSIYHFGKVAFFEFDGLPSCPMVNNSGTSKLLGGVVGGDVVPTLWRPKYETSSLVAVISSLDGTNVAQFSISLDGTFSFDRVLANGSVSTWGTPGLWTSNAPGATVAIEPFTVCYPISGGTPFGLYAHTHDIPPPPN